MLTGSIDTSDVALRLGGLFRRLSFIAATSFGVFMLAVAIVSSDVILVGMILGPLVALVLVLHAPIPAFLIWLGLGPTTSGWLDAALPGGLPALTPDRALLVFVLGAALCRFLRRPVCLMPMGRSELAMALFVLFATASAIAVGGTWRQMSEGGLRGDLVFLALGYVLPFVGFLLAKNMIRSDVQLHMLLATLVIIGAIISVMGILQHKAGVLLFTSTRFRTIHEGRATGSLSNAVEFGMIVDAGVLAAVVLYPRARSLFTKCGLAASIALGLVAIVFSKTRSVWLALALGLTMLVLADRRFRRPILSIGAVGVLVLIVSWPILRETQLAKGRALEVGPIYNRVALTATAAKMAVHRPILGYGWGRFTYLEQRRDHVTSLMGVHPQYAIEMGSPHNTYANLLVMLGLVGLLLYLYILLRGWGNAWRLGSEATMAGTLSRDAALVGLAVVTTFLLCGLFTDLMSYQHASTMTLVMLGVIDGLRVRWSAPPGQESIACPG